MSRRSDEKLTARSSEHQASEKLPIAKIRDAEKLIQQKNQEIDELKSKLFLRVQQDTHNKRLQQALFKISELATGVEDFYTFFKSLHKIISELLYAENFYVALLNSKKNALENTYYINKQKFELAIYEQPTVLLAEKNIITYLFQQRSALLLNDDELNEIQKKIPLEKQQILAKSWLGAPLIVEDKTIGVIVIQSYDENNQFQPWQCELFNYIANTSASALLRKKQKIELEKKFFERSSKLIEEIKRRRVLQKTESTLLDIAELANSKILLNAFYFEIHRLISTLIYAENLYIVLKCGDGEKLEFVYYSDTKDDMSMKEMKLSSVESNCSLTGLLFRKNQSMLLSGKDIDDLFEQGEIIRRGPKTVSWLGVPLRIDEETIGVIVLQSYLKEKVFVEKDVQLMEYISKSVANAIQRKSGQSELEALVDKRTNALKESNLQLTYQIEEKTKAEKLQNALYEIANLTSDVGDLYEFFGSLHEILRGLFYAENFYIGLVENNNLNIQYARDEKDDLLLEGMVLPLNVNTLSTVLFRSNKSFLLDESNLNELVEEYKFELIGSLFESWLGVTLKDNDESIGIMVIQSYRSDVIYTEWHRDLLEFVARHVAIALNRIQYNVNLEKRIKERTFELEKEIEQRKESESTQLALYHIANLANTDIELESFYREIHAIIGTLLYSENLYIAIKEDKSDSIKMVHYVDTMDDYDVDSFSALPLESLKNSLTGYVMSRGETLLTTGDEIKKLAEEKKLELIGIDTISWLGIPLKLNGKVIGIMTLQSYLSDFYYTEKDRDLMVFVAQHVAAAIQRKKNKDYLEFMVLERTNELNQSNAQLKKQIIISEKAKKLQTALYQITDLASGAESMKALYSSVHEIILQLIGAENIYICLYDEVEELLDFVYLVDIEEPSMSEKNLKIKKSKIEKSPTGQVLITGKSILITPENHNVVTVQRKVIVGPEPLYWLGVPLKLDNNVFGVIAAKSYDEKNKLGSEEQSLLEFVSHHIALTLERKQAQDALEKRVIERTSKLAETNASLEQQIVERERSELIQSTLYYVSKLANKDISLQELAAEIHKAIKELVYAENFYIALWNEERQEMDWVYFIDSDDDYDYEYLNQLSKEKRNKSLGRYVVATSKPLMVNQEQIHEMAQKEDILLIGPPSEHYLGVPLISSEDTVGVMAVQSYVKEIQYSNSDKELLVFVAQSIMSTIERHEYHKHLEESVKKRTQELTVSNQLLQKEIIQRKQAVELQRALFKISEMPQLCSTEEELYRRLHEVVSLLMSANNFYIALADKEKKSFDIKYVVDEYDSGMKTVSFDDGLTGYVYRRGEITHITREDIISLEKKGMLKCLGSYPIDWIGVPLISSGDILGIMVLQSYDEHYLYGDKEVDILSFVSTHIAEALQRKYAEKKLSKAYSELAIKTQKAEEASAAKSTFLATVSHEIRTPMNGILGMLSLLNETSLNRRQLDYVSKISTSARTLLAIINDILDFSKMEHGKLELECIEFNILEILENITDLFASKINEKNIDFNINLSPEVVLERVGDSLRLSQVLINLIGNAIKFTEKGYILLSISEPTEGRLFISVEDSGIGIEPEKRDKIFQSFTQADDATTRRFGGSGLGLSICQQLVSMMGGDIKVDGKLGKGSCFSFYVNIAVNHNIIEEKHDFSGITLLLISDTKNQIASWESICERYNIRFQLLNSELAMSNSIPFKFESSISLHVFIDDDIVDSTGIEVAENLRQQFSNSLNCYLLIQPSPHISELPFLEYDIQVVPKPVKIGTLLNRLNLNLDISPAHSKEKTTKFLGKLEGVNLLLAEDNPINQQVAREILKQFGVSITIVDNGKKAVEMVNEHNFDIVLMDMQMPVMDGYRATQIIRKTFSAEQLPIIAMTANVMKGDRERCIGFGMNDYIGKPFERTVLFKIIKNNLIKGSQNANIEHEYQYKRLVDSRQEKIRNGECSINIKALTEEFGSEEFTLELMKIFCDTHHDDSDKIFKLIQSKDYSSAEKLIHKLKGSAGELKMDDLFQLTESIDIQLKKNNPPNESELCQFYKIFKSYISEIKSLI
ncbi:GAF domain-containing protein [Aliikangiella sp. IMCC44359]|uniref:GAF domain-containing protein n=1 Tax=Aliikangiella sp. IMCC44359 TaxID=3459125 RepID=UPI00403B2A87